MFKEFKHYTAWTDAMKSERGYVGLIEYQPKCPGACVHVLWVISPSYACANDAEIAADRMLKEIYDISLIGRVIYSDGIML
jgi:hypothetical protein